MPASMLASTHAPMTQPPAPIQLNGSGPTTPKILLHVAKPPMPTVHPETPSDTLTPASDDDAEGEEELDEDGPSRQHFQVSGIHRLG